MTSLRTITRAAATLVLATASVTFSACGGDDDAGDPDAASSVDAAVGFDAPSSIDAADDPDAETPAPDAGPDAGPDADTTPDATIPPAAPTVTAPAADASIYSPVTVVGTAEANAAIDVVILDGSTEVGTGSGTANGAGAFSLEVTYTDADANDPLTVRVTQTSGGLTSDPTDVAVTQLAIFNLGGNVSQADDGSSLEGTMVKVRLYDSATEVLDFIQEVQITATVGVRLPATAYNFQVPAGTYTVRAFRDSGGPHGPTPDGHPTMWTDPQTPGTAVTITTADSTTSHIVLVTTNAANGYSPFDVTATNSGFEAQPPDYYDAGLGEWVDGDGLCWGFYMAMYTETPGGNVTPPMVRLPDGTDVPMLDDGGCGSTVHDNTSMSYDEEAGDNRFSLGIPNPDAADAGDYVFHYRDTMGNFVHAQVDNIAAVVKLDTKIPTTFPTGAAHNTDLTPTITWAAVANADSYVVSIWGSDRAGGGVGGYNNDGDLTRLVTGTSYTPATGYELIDDEVYEVVISPRVLDATVPYDHDAISYGSRNIFVTDTAGDNVMTVSGDIVNDTGLSGDLLGWVGSFEIPNFGDQQATVVLPSTATSYTMTVFEDPTCTPGAEDGRVVFTIDVDDSGDDGSSGNRGYRTGHQGLEMCGNLTGLDFALSPLVVVLNPTDGQTGVSDTPNMQWENYATTYQTATGNALSTVHPTWSYVWYVQGGSTSGMPEIIWGQPNTATNFDFSSPPAGNNKFDVLTLLSETSLTDLSSATDWRWSLMVVSCDYDEYLSGTATVYTDCIQALLDGNGAGSFAASPQAEFTTD